MVKVLLLFKLDLSLVALGYLWPRGEQKRNKITIVKEKLTLIFRKRQYCCHKTGTKMKVFCTRLFGYLLVILVLSKSNFDSKNTNIEGHDIQGLRTLRDEGLGHCICSAT